MTFVAIPTYLTLLGEKKGSSSNICSKHSKDDGKIGGGKIHGESVYTPTTTSYRLYLPSL